MVVVDLVVKEVEAGAAMAAATGKADRPSWCA